MAVSRDALVENGESLGGAGRNTPKICADCTLDCTPDCTLAWMRPPYWLLSAPLSRPAAERPRGIEIEKPLRRQKYSYFGACAKKNDYRMR
jgi:hypothetical protein